MKKTKLFSVFFSLALCLSAMCSITAFADENDQLTISVKADKENYSNGDNLKFDVTVSNKNDFEINDVSLQASLSDKFEFTENEKYNVTLGANESKIYTISAKPVQAKNSDNNKKGTDSSKNSTDSPKTGVDSPVLAIMIGGASLVLLLKSGKSKKVFSIMMTAALLSSFTFNAPGTVADAAAKSYEISSKADFKYNNADESITVKAKFEIETAAEPAEITVNTDQLEKTGEGTYKTTSEFTAINGTLNDTENIKSFTVETYDIHGDLVNSSDIGTDKNWSVDGSILKEGYNKVVIRAEVSDGTKTENELVIFVPQVLDYNKQALRDVTGVSNARQLGGYINTEGRAIKQNVLLRTANLAHITEPGMKALQEKYKVSDIIDLRYDRELNPNTIDKDIEGIEHHYIPMSATREKAEQVFSQNPDLFAKMQELQRNAGKPGGTLALAVFQAEIGVISAEAHIQYFESDEAIGFYRDAFEIFLNKPEDAAILFHCAGGKDRTGMISMLMLAALDFDKDIMMQDYLMSNTANAKNIEETRAAAEEYADNPELQYNIIFSAAVYPEIMETNINDLTDQYGSVKNFLREKVGLTDDDFNKLKELYLED